MHRLGRGHDARASCRCSPPTSQSAIDAARDEVMKVVMYRDANGDYAFQKAIEIPDADRDVALQDPGARRARSFSTSCSSARPPADDSKRVGEYLRDMASRRAGAAEAADRVREHAGAMGTPLRRRRVGRRGARLGQLHRHAPRHRADPAADFDVGVGQLDPQRQAQAFGERQRQRPRSTRRCARTSSSQQQSFWDRPGPVGQAEPSPGQPQPKLRSSSARWPARRPTTRFCTSIATRRRRA